MYTAHVCACSQQNWVNGWCKQFTCVDVPFVFPSCTPVEVVLPAQ
jgi:hypothetical protein